jgi:hypothetical protein
MTDSFQKCLAIIAVGADAIQAGKVAMAEGAFKMALAGAPSCALEETIAAAKLLSQTASS